MDARARHRAAELAQAGLRERTGLVAEPGFVPVQVAPSVEPPVIRLEAQRGKARSSAVAWGLRPAVGQKGSFCLIRLVSPLNHRVASPLMANSSHAADRTRTSYSSSATAGVELGSLMARKTPASEAEAAAREGAQGLRTGAAVWRPHHKLFLNHR